MRVKIVKEEFPIEILNVPTSLSVQHGRKTNNSEIIKKIKQNTKRIISGFDVFRIAWIHSKKSLQTKKNKKILKIVSFIIYTIKKDFQKIALHKEIAIEYILYTVKLYDPGFQLLLCYCCNH